jgi:hypothetical protein
MQRFGFPVGRDRVCEIEQGLRPVTLDHGAKQGRADLARGPEVLLDGEAK